MGKDLLRASFAIILSCITGISIGYLYTEQFPQEVEVEVYREIHVSEPIWLDLMRSQGFMVESTSMYGKGVGSGFHIGDGWILTAAHVVSGDEDGIIILYNFDGYLESTTEWRATVYAMDEDLDMALLYLAEWEGKEGLTLGSVDLLTPNRMIYTLGCPDGSFPPSLSAGVLKGVGYYQVMFDAGVWYGRSGGAIIDATSGDVIGIVTEIGFRRDDSWDWNISPYTDLGYGVHIDRIIEKLLAWLPR